MEQSESCSQETLEFQLNKQTKKFSFNPAKNVVEEGEWLLGVASFEATVSVFIIPDENNSFSFSTPGH